MNLNELNNQQKTAVKSIGSPILIFAGAGSGKTRVLTHKIAYLVEEVGLPPDNILSVTFTNKAANEMKERVQKLLNIDVSMMNVGTFHSISARILRKEIHRLDYTNDFIIYDQSDSLSLIKKIIKENDLDTKTFVGKSCQAHISKYKNQMISPDMQSNFADGYVESKIAEIYNQYQVELKKNNVLDFDDLLLKPIELFNLKPNRLEFYQNKFQYVLVDEYQDTNRPQFEFIYAVSKNHGNICVVGDDDQSIYGWRGADVQNILNFSSSFSNVETIKLEQNYRSTKTILECAWSVVSKNTNRAEKKLWTENKKGDQLEILESYDERIEAKRIYESINQLLIKSNRSFNDIVILYRTNSQSRSIEDVLRREGIPYQIIGGVKFYDRKEIKDIIAYLRFIVNPLDSVSFDRIINFPSRGIGKTTLKKLYEHSNENDMNMLEILNDTNDLKIGKKQSNSIQNFYDIIEKYKNKYLKESILTLINDLLLDLNLKEYYVNQSTTEALTRWENIEELVNSIAEFCENRKDANLNVFLEEVSLLTDIDKWNDQDKAITLMTIHSSKGLEFPIVFLSGLEEGLFPLSSSLDSEDEIEEERRLFYVALTRAEEKVYLSYANNRRRFGGVPMAASTSRFLFEIPGKYIDNRKKLNNQDSFNQFESSQKNFNQTQISIGHYVHHKLYGSGKVLSIEGRGENSKITIQFSSNQRKKFISKYANLKIIKRT